MPSALHLAGCTAEWIGGEEGEMKKEGEGGGKGEGDVKGKGEGRGRYIYMGVTDMM